jgi:hypothetical protein
MLVLNIIHIENYQKEFPHLLLTYRGNHWLKYCAPYVDLNRAYYRSTIHQSRSHKRHAIKYLFSNEICERLLEDVFLHLKRKFLRNRNRLRFIQIQRKFRPLLRNPAWLIRTYFKTMYNEVPKPKFNSYGHAQYKKYIIYVLDYLKLFDKQNSLRKLIEEIAFITKGWYLESIALLLRALTRSWNVENKALLLRGLVSRCNFSDSQQNELILFIIGEESVDFIALFLYIFNQDHIYTKFLEKIDL